jgi:Spy/CpxP family protein refolding chaperone
MTQGSYVRYRTTVSTSDSDSEGKPQTAISPGYLMKDWHQAGRHYFTYDMGTVPMADFISYNSGRYEVTRDTDQGINGPIAIEVYHIPSHKFDVQDMIASSKAGLAYYERNYGPYQYRQYRIIEYPRYRQFAESLPNTVPFSEAIGFIDRVEKPDDIDECYFVTSHELAHQWWGHQLVGGNVEGSTMMSESLAEYSALRVMEKRYGTQNMRKFLAHELDGYLRGRSGEIRHENPLAFVQNETQTQDGWMQRRAGGVIIRRIEHQLNITSGQRSQIKAILDQEKPTIQSLASRVRQQNEELAQRTTFNEADVRAFAQQHVSTMEDVLVEREKVRTELLQVLTLEQRQKLRQIRAARSADVLQRLSLLGEQI